MTNLYDLKLSDLLPSSIKDNKEIAALAAALDGELQAITACINEIVLMPRIDELPEDIIDSLAWQLHVDFYEPLGLDLAKKRELVKNSIQWHRRRGTKSVLVEMIALLFFDNVDISEWYEYGGDPYFFRIELIDAIFESKDVFTRLITAVYALKNVRSWLELIKITLHVETDLYYAGAMIADKATLRTKDRLPGDTSVSSDLYVSGAALFDKSVVRPKDKTLKNMSMKATQYYGTGMWDISRISVPTKEIRGEVLY